MTIPQNLIPSTVAEILAEQDALKASTTFRRLPATELPRFLLDLTTKIVSNPVDPSKLYSRNTAIRQSYYSALIRTAKTESSLLILAIKYDKFASLTTASLKTEYVNRLSNLVMIFMGKYSAILKDVPRSDIISNKLGKDVYFHLIKRLPDLVTLINNPDPTASTQALVDAVYYIKSSVTHPLSRFISLLLGELSSTGHRPDIDRREFKREQAADKKNLKEDFRKNKKFYKSKWLALRSEAFATLSNLDIEASVSSNSQKTRDTLNERRARIDNFIYSLEQGVQSITNSSFEGFVSAKVAIEDSLIEYSKRLEFRTLARKSREIDEAFNLKAKKKTDKSGTYYRNTEATRAKKTGMNSSMDAKVHGVLKHLGPAGLAAYAAYKLASNPVTRALVNNPITRNLIARPLRFIGAKSIDGIGIAARSIFNIGNVVKLGRGLAALGNYTVRAGKAVGRVASRGYKSVSSNVGQLYAKTTSEQSKERVVKLADRAMYGAGYGAGKTVRAAKNVSGLLSKLMRSGSSTSSLPALPSRTEPDTSGLFSAEEFNTKEDKPSTKPGFPLELLTGPTNLPKMNSGKVSNSGFPISLISGIDSSPIPRMKSGLSSPRADLFIDDVLERIDEHIPYIPADLNEEDFTLDDLKTTIEDVLENFLIGQESTGLKDKISDIVEQSTKNSAGSLATVVQSKLAEETINYLLPKISDIVAEDKSKSLVSIPVTPVSSLNKYADNLLVPNTKPLEEFKPASLPRTKPDTRLSELVSTSVGIQEQLISIDKRLDELIAEKAKLSPYSGSSFTEIRSFLKEHKLFDTSRSAKPISKTEDEILEEETSKREDKSDRRELIRAVQNISNSRKNQTGGFNVASLATFSPLISKAMSLIGGVLGGSSGSIIKSVLPSVLKYVPILARFALPALALAGTAYAAWEVGSSLYNKYATEILDAIEGAVSIATDIVDGITSGYDSLVSFMKNPADKLRETGTKLSNWWEKSSLKSGIATSVSTAKTTATNISNKVSAIGATMSSGIRSASSNVVDKVQSTASGAKNYVSNSVGKLFSTNKESVDFDNLDPGAKSSFEAMAQEYRSLGGSKPLSIESARRTTEEQAKLYAANPSIAAKPGRSLHEQGRALDIDRATAGDLEKMGLLSKYGFSRNVKGEPWHLSYTGRSASGGLPSTLPSSTSTGAQTKTVNQTSPTSVAPSYTSTTPTSTVQSPAATIQPQVQNRSSDPIHTFSFLDSSFFVLNAGMMAS